MLGLDLSAARLADEERPVRRALVVLPPRHMTAAPRHRQSRSARLRGQLRPSDDHRLVFSDRWARSLSGPSPACRSPVRLAARGPLACSPPPPRVPAPPRLPPPCLTRALWRGRARVSGTNGAATARAVAAPPLRRARPHSGKILPRSGAQSQDALRRRHALPRCLSVRVQLTAASCRVGRPAPRRASAARSCGLPPPPPALAPPSPRPPSPQSPRVSTNTLPAATQGRVVCVTLCE